MAIPTSTPRVTVVIPVYNREVMVRQSVESALGQTYRDFEVIVVDDGSTDGTPDVLDSFDDQIRVLRQPNHGAYAARNMALKHARGTYVAFLDSDDAWFPQRLERQVKLLDEDHETALVFADGAIVRNGTVTHHFFERWRPARGMVFEQLARYNFIPQSSVLVHRECFEELGPFKEVPLRADYHKWLQIARKHRIDYVDEVLFSYAHHPGNQSRDRTARYVYMLELLDSLIAEEEDPRRASLLRARRWQQEYELGLSRTYSGTMQLASAFLGRGRGVPIVSRVRMAGRTTLGLARHAVRGLRLRGMR